MKFYVCEDDINSSIEYFKSIGIDSNDMLMLYLLSKHRGITTTYPVSYGGGISEEQKKDCLNAIWQLGGLFDESEKCNKRGVMFPTGFKANELYNPGTEFSGLVGRVRDTIKQKVNTLPLYEYNDGTVTLKSNFKELLNDYCLKGNKLSLSHLAAWVFRFIAFDFQTTPDQKSFSRVVNKAIKKFFKINKNDFLWLFEDDLSLNRLTPSRTKFTGEKLRSAFTFENGKEPEIIEEEEANSYLQSLVDKNRVEEYLTLIGDNPSDNDIIDILKNKKQIILTGVPGVGKSRYTNMIAENVFFSGSKIIQFHANYGYEDFIGSETLKNENNATSVVSRKGVFLTFIEEALNNPSENYLFIIDEINRGNIAEIFGETILALDRKYSVELNRQYGEVTNLTIPENFYIVGTMNTSDRNIAFLDLALRRRFAFIRLQPNYDFLSEEVELEDYDLGNILKLINQRILSVLKDRELILGQSYFIPNIKDNQYVWQFEQFKNQFNFVLLPTLYEYSFGNSAAVESIVGEALGSSIQEVDEFKAAFYAEFEFMRNH